MLHHAKVLKHSRSTPTAQGSHDCAAARQPASKDRQTDKERHTQHSTAQHDGTAQHTHRERHTAQHNDTHRERERRGRGAAARRVCYTQHHAQKGTALHQRSRSPCVARTPKERSTDAMTHKEKERKEGSRSQPLGVRATHTERHSTTHADTTRTQRERHSTHREKEREEEKHTQRETERERHSMHTPREEEERHSTVSNCASRSPHSTTPAQPLHDCSLLE